MMSDDYLWNRLGSPDPDELWLEQFLPLVKESRTQMTALDSEVPFLIHQEVVASPSRARAISITALAVAVAAAAAIVVCVGVGFEDGPDLTGPALPGQGESLSLEDDDKVLPALHDQPEVERAGPVSGSMAFPVPDKDDSDHGSGKTSDAPKKQLKSVSPTSEAKRDLTEVRRAVGRQAAGLEAECLDASSAEEVRIDLSIRIAPNGTVESATASARTEGNTSVARCAERQARTWRFAPARDVTRLTLPVVLTKSR